jgi:hypothetical protein
MDLLRLCMRKGPVYDMPLTALLIPVLSRSIISWLGQAPLYLPNMVRLRVLFILTSLWYNGRGVI